MNQFIILIGTQKPTESQEPMTNDARIEAIIIVHLIPAIKFHFNWLTYYTEKKK